MNTLNRAQVFQLNDRAVMEAYGFWGKLNSKRE